MKRGYIGRLTNNDKAYNALIKLEVDSFHIELNDLLKTLKSKDEIVIHDMRDLNISMREFVKQTAPLRNCHISIHVINQFKMDLDTYLDVIESSLKMEQRWIADRTKEGLEKAKEKGNIVGRPKLPSDKIKEINYWYGQKLSLRSISEKTDVSLGTVHKYVSHLKEDNS